MRGNWLKDLQITKTRRIADSIFDGINFKDVGYFRKEWRTLMEKWQWRISRMPIVPSGPMAKRCEREINLNMKRLQRKQYTQMRTSNNKQHQYTMTRKKMPDWRHLFICISLSLYQSKANTKKMASYIVKVRWVPVKGSVKKWQNFSLFTLAALNTLIINYGAVDEHQARTII